MEMDETKCDSALHSTQSFRSPKCIYAFIVGALLFGLFVCVLLFLNFNTFKSINTENYTVDEGKLSYNIDSVTVEQGYVTITGWAADVSESIQIANCAVLLREELSGEYYQIKTVSEYRAGISEALNTEQNIENCGFKAKTSLNHLNKNSTYEICVLYLHDDNSILCHTGQRMNVKGEVISEQDL